MCCRRPPVSDAGTGMADLERGGSQRIARPRTFVSVREERYEAMRPHLPKVEGVIETFGWRKMECE